MNRVRGIGPDDPTVPVPGRELLAPSWSAPLGTDELGRDVLDRIVAGAPSTLGVAAIALAAAVAAGVPFALIAGWYAHRFAGRVVGGVGQALLILPPIWVPLVLVALLGRGPGPLVLAVVLGALPEFLWVLGQEVVALRERPWVQAARMTGLSTPRILVVEILPHLLPSVAVLTLLQIRTAVLVVATLAFLGLGPAPPAPSWGLMIAEGRTFFPSSWWIVTFPTLALSLCIVTAGLAARRLRAPAVALPAGVLR